MVYLAGFKCFLSGMLGIVSNSYISSFPLGKKRGEKIGSLCSFLLTVKLQSSQVKHTSQDTINEFIIWKLNPLVVVDIFRFISACVMSREFTREAVRTFLSAQFPWIWCECLLRNLIHSKIFYLTRYREVLVKYSLLITHAGMLIWIWH